MEIRWYGLGCFRLSERGYPVVVTDPFSEDEAGLSLPRGGVDVVTSSALIDDYRSASWPGLRGVARTVASPGEYEIGGTFITSVAATGSEEPGSIVSDSVVHAINYDGVVVCHLGALTRTPTQSQVEAIGRVDVLLIPVGIPGTSPAVTSETISLIEPDIVVPMRYEVPGLKLDRLPVTGFLKEMGIAQPTLVPVLKVTAGSKPEEIQIILLEPQ